MIVVSFLNKKTRRERHNQIIDRGIVADDDSVILEEEVEDPLDNIIARDHEETQQEEANVEVRWGV